MDDSVGSDDAVRMLDQLCCGGCYPGSPDCLHPLLEFALVEVAGLCSCGDQTAGPCPECVDRLWPAAERCRLSGLWGVLHQEAAAMQSFRVAREAGLIDAPMETDLVEAFDLDEWLSWGGCAYLEARMAGVIAWGNDPASRVDELVDRIQAEAEPMVRDWNGLQPRSGPAVPPRVGYGGAEAAIAGRLGLGKPARWLVEEAVREAALAAWTEADFIREAESRGLRFVPFVTPRGVEAYSAVLMTLPVEVQREYGAGKSLAKDLSLSRLRPEFGGLSSRGGAAVDARGAWADHEVDASGLRREFMVAAWRSGGARGRPRRLRCA